MLSLALALLLASPSAEPLQPRLLVMDLRDDGAGPQIVRLLRDALTTHIAREGVVEVISTEDVRRQIDLETQKVATCNADASDATAACLAEIGSALGARYIVYGNVGALGAATVVNLSIAETDKGVTVGRALVQSEARERLPDEVGKAMHTMFIEAGLIAPERPSSLPWILGGTAGVVVGCGLLAVGVIAALGADGIVADTTSSRDDKDAAEGSRAGATTLAVVGSIVTAASAALFAVPSVLE